MVSTSALLSESYSVVYREVICHGNISITADVTPHSACITINALKCFSWFTHGVINRKTAQNTYDDIQNSLVQNACSFLNTFGMRKDAATIISEFHEYAKLLYDSPRCHMPYFQLFSSSLISPCIMFSE